MPGVPFEYKPEETKPRKSREKYHLPEFSTELTNFTLDFFCRDNKKFAVPKDRTQASGVVADKFHHYVTKSIADGPIFENIYIDIKF